MLVPVEIFCLLWFDEKFEKIANFDSRFAILLTSVSSCKIDENILHKLKRFMSVSAKTGVKCTTRRRTWTLEQILLSYQTILSSFFQLFSQTDSQFHVSWLFLLWKKCWDPSCESSVTCELQLLSLRYKVMKSRCCCWLYSLFYIWSKLTKTTFSNILKSKLCQIFD